MSGYFQDSKEPSPMMGTLRFFMASCVVLFHLTEKVQNIGILSVIFFYSISGFLITLVLHETYRFRLKAFSENRLLRLYPAYVATLLAGFLASTLESFSTFHPVWSGTGSSLDMLGNLLIIPWGIVAGSDIPQYRIVPSSWSVGVELCCYALLWIVTARSWKLALTSALASIVWYATVDIAGLSPSLKYFPVPAAMLPFSLGAMAYFLSRRAGVLTELSRNPMAQAGIFAVCVMSFLVIWHSSLNSTQIIFDHWTYYANMVLAFITVLLINRARMPGSVGRVDKFLGDLAYPVFLGHFIYAFFVWKLFAMPSRGWTLFAIAYPLTILVSIVIAHYIDRPINALRSRVRDLASITSNEQLAGGCQAPSLGKRVPTTKQPPV